MMKHAISGLVVLALAGCGFGSGGGQTGGGGLFRGDEDVPVPVPVTPLPEEALDAGEEAVAAEAGAAGEDGEADSSGGIFLGFAVASLGDASVSGLWMETPLVTSVGPGRVVGPDGRAVAVTLRPTGGAQGSASRLSLQAMQALGLDLTSLPTVTVISDA